MISTCEIRWCKRQNAELVYIAENIGDGSWLVGICKQCAEKLGLASGGDLPSPRTVKKLITGRK